MEETKAILRDLITTSKTSNKLFKRNILKAYLQILVLDFIYSNPEYSQMFFYGGSCLAHCFGLNRLSEDLDFVDVGKKIKVVKLADDLKVYFDSQTDLKITIKIQDPAIVDAETKSSHKIHRIYLKFPILHDLELTDKSESDLLLLKVEVFKDFDFAKDYRTEIIPLFKFNKSILIKTFDLSTLMATKIRAILHRKWEKINKGGEIIATVKGRDYYDLMWYLEKGIKPNLHCIEEISSSEELKELLLKAVDKADDKSIALDLESFIDKPDFIKNMANNIKNILRRDIDIL